MKPVLAIGAFHGTALEMFEQFIPQLEALGVTPQELQSLRRTCSADLNIRLLAKLFSNLQPSSIFLSHNHADKPFVRRLAQDLQAAGVRVWLDEAEMLIGDSLIEKIRQGIDEMEYLGVILSPNSVKSSWVQREVDVAMNQEIEGKRVKVLPLVIEDCDLPGFLKGKLYGDFRAPERYKEEFAKVLKRLAKTQP
jgi:hypothetical protein